jgi:hypothetical protein
VSLEETTTALYFLQAPNYTVTSDDVPNSSIAIALALRPLAAFTNVSRPRDGNLAPFSLLEITDRDQFWLGHVWKF